MPAGLGGVGVPVQLGVIVGVNIDETGGHDKPGRVDFPAAPAAHLTEFCDAAIFDGDITGVGGHARAINYPAAPDDEIEFSWRL